MSNIKVIKKISKLFSVFMASLLVLLSFDAKYVYADTDFFTIEKKHYSSFSEAFNLSYNIFLDAIGKNDLEDVNAYWVRMRDYNDKLIIGGSGVVWCGDTLKESADFYGYDIVGFGGMTDNKIKEWLPKINKKYKKIIIFEGVNTINLALGYGMKKITQQLIESVATTIVDVQNQLLLEGGELVYVKVKPMTFPQDTGDKKTAETFNKMSAELNVALSVMNVSLYELKYPTTNEYSSGYVHYNNKIVWDDLLS